MLVLFCSRKDRLLACSSSTAIAVSHRGVSVHADAIRPAICREYDVARSARENGRISRARE